MPLAPLPHWAFFLFLSPASAVDVCMAVGVGGRVTTTTVGEEPTAWAISNARKSRVFSSKPMVVKG